MRCSAAHHRAPVHVMRNPKAKHFRFVYIGPRTTRLYKFRKGDASRRKFEHRLSVVGSLYLVSSAKRILPSDLRFAGSILPNNHSQTNPLSIYVLFQNNNQYFLAPVVGCIISLWSTASVRRSVRYCLPGCIRRNTMENQSRCEPKP